MLTVWAPSGVGEVQVGDDLGAMLLASISAEGRELSDGDIVLVTSKVVSKAEGQARPGTRDDYLAGETARLVASRGVTQIVRNRQGLTMAAAGIDASNVSAGSVLLLPRDPDASARSIRRTLTATGVTVGVIVTDTAGRPWREGQTDIAIGAAGIAVLESFNGQEDAYGNPLLVTAPAVADELAGAAELAQGKLGARPFAVISGRPDLVLPVTDDGPGAAALIRADGTDLFGYGAREAVVRALRGASEDRAPFGPAAPDDELCAALERALDIRSTDIIGVGSGNLTVTGPTVEAVGLGRLAALTVAFGWTISFVDTTGVTIRPLSP